jgi:ribosomal protein S18 acetylase RimI-like enzyme
MINFMTVQPVENRSEYPVSTDWIGRVVIRQMAATDLAGLEWGGEFTHFRRVYADAYQRSVSGSAVLWVAELPGEGIIGQVFLQLVCDRSELADGRRRAYLYSFRIRPKFRRAGLGTRIMVMVEEFLRRRGFQSVTLNVAKTNVDAQRLYFRRGYRIVAHEPGIWSYPDENGVWRQVEEPAWRLEKRLK